MAKLKHPTAAAVNVGGKLIEPDKAGLFDVPDEFVDGLVETHGFVPATPAPKSEGKKAD